MGFAKRKPEPAPDLAGEILRLRGQIDSFIDAKVAELKRSADGANQPIGSLRQMLTRGDSCHCRSAMRILAERSE